MESLKRKIKIFWTEHSDPILFYTIVIIAVFLILKGLNALAIMNQKNNSNKIANNSYINQEENINNKTLVKKFIENCKEKNIEKAYELLSEDCKQKLYPTVKDFTNLYYNKRFNKDREIEIKYETNGLYKITFYENILEQGSTNKISNTEEYFKIVPEVIEDKLYINYSKNTN